MIEQLAANQCRTGRGGGVVLQLVEEAGLGGGWRGQGFGRGQGVKDEGGEGQLGGEGCGGEGEEGGEQMGANGRLAGAGLASVESRSVLLLPRGEKETNKKTTAWFSARSPTLVQIRAARSSAPAMALPSLPPSGPLAEDL